MVNSTLTRCAHSPGRKKMIDPLVDQFFRLDRCRRMTGRKGQSRRIASASAPRVGQHIRERAKYGTRRGRIEVTSDDDRRRTIKIRIGGEVSQGLQLRDSIIVVSGLVLQARGDHVQWSRRVSQRRDHGYWCKATVPCRHLDLLQLADRPTAHPLTSPAMAT